MTAGTTIARAPNLAELALKQLVPRRRSEPERQFQVSRIVTVWLLTPVGQVLSMSATVEVKCRANGFTQLYGWLDAAKIVVVKRDRAEPTEGNRNRNLR